MLFYILDVSDTAPFVSVSPYFFEIRVNFYVSTRSICLGDATNTFETFLPKLFFSLFAKLVSYFRKVVFEMYFARKDYCLLQTRFYIIYCQIPNKRTYELLLRLKMYQILFQFSVIVSNSKTLH